MLKRTAVLAPFFFTLASLLQLNYVALIVASPEQTIRPLLLLWLLLFLLFLTLYAFLRDVTWVALLLTVFVAGFYFSSSFFSTVLLLVALMSLLWLLFSRLRRSTVDAVQISTLLTLVSLFFVGYSSALIYRTLSTVPWGQYRESISEIQTHSLEMHSPIKRDIYLIILDGYAREDILQELYRFDNSEFRTYLQEQGFVIPPASTSNYPTTHLSLASILNIDYVQSFAPGLEHSYQRWLMSPFIDHSRVRALLERQGYTTVSISTNWSITDNTTTDVYFQPYPVMFNDFEGFLFDSTPLKLLGPLLDGFAAIPSYKTHRNTLLYNFEMLSALSEMPGPKFVVAHIIAPHPPFVFDEDGAPLDLPHSFSFKDAAEYSGSKEEYHQRYLGQLQFVNASLQPVIESILSKSQTLPIIILQADHGPGMLADFTSAENTCIKERFSPFTAYYLPDVDSLQIPADISGVNVFRIIFNEYFGARLSLLENRQYFYAQPVSFYQFEDVTTRIAEACQSR